MSFKIFSNKKGFTLIELLVVISIIGLLSTVVLASLNGARVKARDSKRIQDLTQLRNALAIYANDNGGNYPGNSSNCNAFYNSADSSWNTSANPLYELVTGGYISTLPIDPINTGDPVNGASVYGYTYLVYDYCDPPEDYDLVSNFESSGQINSCASRDWKIHSIAPSSCSGTDSLCTCLNNVGTIFADH